jgi:hypothetical protein
MVFLELRKQAQPLGVERVPVHNLGWAHNWLGIGRDLWLIHQAETAATDFVDGFAGGACNRTIDLVLSHLEPFFFGECFDLQSESPASSATRNEAVLSAALVFRRGNADPLTRVPASFGFQANQHAVTAPLGSHNAAAAKSFFHVHELVLLWFGLN